MAPNGGGRFPFLGVQEVLMGRVSPDALLCPPDAVGDESRSLTPAQLANQVRRACDCGGRGCRRC